MKSKPCSHLEKLISEPSKEPKFESTHQYAGNNIDKSYYESGAGYVIPEGIKNRTYEMQFRHKLEKAGIAELPIDILTLRFVYSMSFRDISEELGVVSVTTAVRLYSEALATLKKRGFK